MGIKLENYEMIDIEKFIFVYLFQLICRPSVTYGIQSVFNKLCKPSIEVKFLVIVCQNFSLLISNIYHDKKWIRFNEEGNECRVSN